MGTYMSSMNISIKKEAYEYLESLKTEGKSFSDVILSFKRDKSPMDFFGKLKDKDWTQAEQCMKNLRTSFEERLHDRP